MEKFSTGVASHLKHYVYRLIDPRNGQTFYVGKGQYDRVFQHVNEEILESDESQVDHDETEETRSLKLETIKEIKKANLWPIHVVHRHGLEVKEAFEVEAALIDVFYPTLTNEVRGHGIEFGPAHVEQLDQLYTSRLMNPDPQHKLLYIKTSHARWNETGSLYEAVRSAWRLSPHHANEANFVLAIVSSVCRGVFVVDEWKPSREANRWEFVGWQVEDEPIVDRYVNKLIPEDKRKRGMASPVLYGW